MNNGMDFTQTISELDRQTTEEASRSFQEGRKNGGFLALRRMVGAFWTTYYSEKACRDGVPGLFRAVNAGMRHFLIYAKHWELERNAKRS